MDAPTRRPADVEEDLVPISALQHYLFCPRQCALIHVERIWEENAKTAEGRVLHERAHAGTNEMRPKIRIARSLSLRSLTLGVSGVADIVEFKFDSRGASTPFPIEYKRGRSKSHRADEVQLCAQAICLEEAFATTVAEGALFYGETRRRHPVVFDRGLRELTAEIADKTRAIIASGRTPPAVRIPGCRQCSLIEACRPDTMQCAPSTLAWLERQIKV